MSPTDADRLDARLALISEGQDALVTLVRQHARQVADRAAEDASRAGVMVAEAERISGMVRAARVTFESGR